MEVLLEKLNKFGFHQHAQKDWVGVYPSSIDSLDPVDVIQQYAEELSRSDAPRGGRFRHISPSPDHRWFIKQYHHGGLLAERGDVRFRSPERFLLELLGTVTARNNGVPTPRPVGVFWHETKDGYAGFYVSSWLDAAPATRHLRSGNHPDLMHRCGRYLATLHDAGVDHQDYKLDNILLDEEDQLYVIDFDPVEIGDLHLFNREQRLHRFLRFLSKYGFSDCNESEFVNGYRSATDHSSPVLFHMLQLPNWLRNTGSDLLSQFSTQPLQPVDLENVIVRAPNWLGDCVMSLPFLQELSEQLPGDSVDVVCREHVSDVFESSPAVERTWPMNSDKTTRFPDRVREERYSLSIVIPKSFRTALQAWRTGIPRRLGFSTGLRSMLLTNPVPLLNRDRTLHHARLYAELLPAPLDQPDELPDVDLRIPDAWSSNTPREWFSGNYISVHPGSAYGPAKRWPPDRFQRFLLNVLEKEDADITFLGVSSEQAITDEILNGLPSDRVNDLVGRTTLRQCMVVLEHSRATVANDSGLMHLSAGLGTPVVALFGSSSPDLTSPLGHGHNVIYENVECSPCFEETCPRNRDRYKCLTQITAETVYEHFAEVLANEK